MGSAVLGAWLNYNDLLGEAGSAVAFPIAVIVGVAMKLLWRCSAMAGSFKRNAPTMQDAKAGSAFFKSSGPSISG